MLFRLLLTVLNMQSKHFNMSLELNCPMIWYASTPMKEMPGSIMISSLNTMLHSTPITSTRVEDKPHECAALCNYFDFTKLMLQHLKMKQEWEKKEENFQDLYKISKHGLEAQPFSSQKILKFKQEISHLAENLQRKIVCGRCTH